MRTLHPSIRSALAALFATAAILAFGCNQGREGDRCNPSLNTNGHDECGGGLTCFSPPFCPEAYCCPQSSDGSLGKSSNPNCQPGCNGGAASACTAGDTDACAFVNPPEAGADAGSETGTETGTEAATDSASSTDSSSEASKAEGGGDSSSD